MMDEESNSWRGRVRKRNHLARLICIFVGIPFDSVFLSCADSVNAVYSFSDHFESQRIPDSFPIGGGGNHFVITRWIPTIRY